MTREQRMTEFVNRFCEDYSKFEQMLPDTGQQTILRMMGNLGYVRDFVLIPTFCRMETKLPKGTKKTDGRKVTIRAGHDKCKSQKTEYLIDCGDDLYISGIISRAQSENGVVEIKKLWLVVEAWKTISAMHIIAELEQGGKLVAPEIRNGILQLYKDSNLPLGLLESTMIDPTDEYVPHPKSNYEGTAPPGLEGTGEYERQGVDVGFRVLKLESVNETSYGNDGEYAVKPERTDLDLLFGCMLEWGLLLSMPYHSEDIDGCTVYTVGDGELIACFDENMTENVIIEIAKRQPSRVSVIKSRLNVRELFGALAPNTRVQII